MKLIAILAAVSLAFGCGKKDADDDGGSKNGAADATETLGDDPAVTTETKSSEVDSDSIDVRDPLAPEIGDSTSSIRLLTPAELNRKSSAIFAQEWMVEMPVFSEEDPNGTAILNGFDAYNGNLNGIDYNDQNEYAETGSTLYISTHEKFCRDLTEASFSNADSRATFFGATSAADTLNTRRSQIESNLERLQLQMFGEDSDTAPGMFAAIVSLYSDLEGESAAARAQIHPLQLTVQAMCFTTPYVHTL